jgi:hypothetical protein
MAPSVDAVPVSAAPLTADEPLDVAAAFGVGGDVSAEDPEPVLVDAGGAGNAPEAAEPVAETQDAPATATGEIEWASLLGDANAEGEAEPEPEPTTEVEGALEQEFAVEAVDDAVYVEAEPAPEPEPAPAPPPEPVPVQSASRADLDSIAALTAAAQNPSLQFQASAQLGRLLLRLGRERDGIEWLEKASQAATPAREQRLDVMYELADALERAGERARALDVFADLDFDAASYRDVPERMAALRRGLEEGPVP